jgi:large subunit ribosomal protein L23
MELTRVILGQVITEKSEILKQDKVYALKVAPSATKVDVKNALRTFFGVEVSSVRALKVGSKTRSIGVRSIVKRKPFKKVFVTLTKDSKGLDLTQFKAA